MQREKLELTEEDGHAALQGHVVERAQIARARHGPDFDEASILALLSDPELVRFPTELVFDAASLVPGEFAFARPRGERPSDGYTLCVHPFFEGRWDVLPALIAYHVPSINYLDIAGHEEAELFGATLLGLDVDAYYERICELADSIPGAPAHDPQLAARFAAETSCSSGGCSCGQASLP